MEYVIAWLLLSIIAALAIGWFIRGGERDNADFIESLRLLELQRNRCMYKVDDQIKTQAEVAKFLDKHK